MSTGRKSVLVVDDEPMIRQTLELLLAYDGHQVQTASSGPAALAAMEQKRFDVVFTDFNMPLMNGHELATRIKARSPEQPVVMVTAYADVVLEGKPLPCVDEMVGKPFTLKQLRDALAKVSAPKLEEASHQE